MNRKTSLVSPGKKSARANQRNMWRKGYFFICGAPRRPARWGMIATRPPLIWARALASGLAAMRAVLNDRGAAARRECRSPGLLAGLPGGRAMPRRPLGCTGARAGGRPRACEHGRSNSDSSGNSADSCGSGISAPVWIRPTAVLIHCISWLLYNSHTPRD